MRTTSSNGSILLLALVVSTVVPGACTGIIGGDSTEAAQQGLCADGSVKVPVSPLRRLTRREYNNAIRDLFGDDSRPADAFVPDEQVGGFAANAIAPVTELQVKDYMDAAAAVAERAMSAHVLAELGCDPADDDCARGYLAALARRAFRRPLESGVEENLFVVYQSGKTQWGAEKGLELAIRAILLSPHFLYQVELPSADAAVGAIVPLDDFQIATRLSFFLWQSIPDEELLAAAETGALGTREGIATQARRMLADARSREAVESFFTEWLELEGLRERVKDAEAFPTWNEDLATSMEKETVAFADHVLRSGETLTTLLTAPYSFVDGPLAELYGVAPPAEPWQRVDFAAGERAGLLTQASYLASRAHAVDTSWVYRGKFVRERLLCMTMPDPPPNIIQDMNNDPSRVTNPKCKDCHLLMDPIGLGFERYDAIGRFMADATAHGELLSAGELSGPFDSPAELATTLATSEEVQHCVAVHAFRYATRRRDARDDGCSLDAVDTMFAEADLKLSDLLVAIATTDAFRFQRISD